MPAPTTKTGTQYQQTPAIPPPVPPPATGAAPTGGPLGTPKPPTPGGYTQTPKPQGQPGSKPAPAGPPPTTAGLLDTQFGQGAGTAFGPWQNGANPLDTAQALAQRNLGQALAGIRARYGANGLGNSGREALSEGEATGSAIAQLGDLLAQRGMDQNKTALSALLGAGSQNLQGRALDLQNAQQLGTQGQAFTGISASEQNPPLMNAIMNLLGMFGPVSTSGQSTQTTSTHSF